jgi:phage tail sheath protein FI
MRLDYAIPGVYVEEVPSGARPLTPLGTSTAAFIGKAPGALAPSNGEPLAVNNWTQFRDLFCKDAQERGKSPVYSKKGTPLAYAVYGFFQNGGDRCYVINSPSDSLSEALMRLESVDEVAIVSAPGYCDPASYDTLLTHCENMTDRVAVLDAPLEVENIDLLKEVGVEPLAGGPAAGAGASKGLRPRQSDKGFGAFYFPWIRIRDPFYEKRDDNGSSNRDPNVDVPPSGHVAGIYARTDGTRGVHKAPANELIRGALNVVHRVSPQEQRVLNPAGVNCIRFFPREGIRVWGARTLAPESSEWRYLNVRRLFSMIEKTIALDTRWIVFEPNDQTLWKAIRRDVSAFLTLLWRQGALMGRAPEDAFFVRCDEETNDQITIDAGRVRTVIGIAPVKPAEFVIFEIGQTVAGAEVAVAS